ncbi:MAG: hypothetical protein P4L85_19385 [Paludisphaera borealis]|uniref:hypothetical protein n=1 Tax=Paludisphaera borealis TaxID=1387353 RepID=UPI002843BDBB|nr:hypothetical protein [Paludisphaera borealis]MDR3621523.1 hypothetical protein [Paludisphaera borealis]
MTGRFRSLRPPWFVIVGVAAFLVAEGFLQYIERRLGAGAFDVKVRPGLVVLYAVAVVYGVYRAVTSHPFFDDGYRDWLSRTPWTVAKPLPLGPIQLCGRDAVVLSLLVALNLISPQRDSMRILCLFLFVQCAILTIANWWTTDSAYAYLGSFGLALMIRLWGHPWVCFAAGAATYLVVHEGVWQALRAFPWNPSYALSFSPDVAIRDRQSPVTPCGWPFDRLFRDPVAKTGAPATGLDALAWSLLLGWWISCLASRFTERHDAVVFTHFCTFIVLWTSLLWRLIVYTGAGAYELPLGLFGRIATGRWIIPGYDIVFLAPVLIVLLALPMVLVGFMSRGVPAEIYGPILSALVVFLALRTPPGLKRWRLTGEHRMVSRISKLNKEYVSTS